jgi:phospholipid/cholesterol/gamma-HCH transport system substrate-binding protein
MRARAQRIRLGIFIFISSVILLLLVGYFTARRYFEKTDTYYIAYKDISVSGLETGSPVKYLGITVGSISEIRIDPKDVNSIIVRISLKEGTPVKEDAVADIVAMGITGLRTIEIRGGTNEADFLQPEQFIHPGTSLVDDISGRAEVIAYKVEDVLNNIQAFTQEDNIRKFTEAAEKFSELANNANKSFSLFDEVLEENRTGIRQVVESVGTITLMLELTAEELYLASGRFNEIMQSDTLSVVLGNIRDISVSLKESNIEELIANLAFTAGQTQRLLVKLDADLERGSKDLSDNLILLKQMLENMNEVSRQISSDPSVLLRGQRARDIPDRRLQ